MAEPGGIQRHYRAPCPGCGAPVEFHSAQSTHAVCSYCRSTVVRQGEQLARIGKMAELFEDFSPLQLAAAGRFGQQPFTLVGRLQYGTDGGRWTEWIAQLDGGRLGTLSEDNGQYVFSQTLALPQGAPPADALRVGMTTAVAGRSYTVASNTEAALLSAQGELPRLPEPGRAFRVVELRNHEGEVLSLDYDSTPPSAWLGRQVALDDLQLTGLRSDSGRQEQGRAFNCPHCGAPVTVQLEVSKSVTCGSCKSLIDLSAGLGAELRYAVQDEPVRPLIALGRVGRLEGTDWQVVGFQHRLGRSPGDDEQFGWSEYLLYNRQKGFCFLVDAEDGWSLVRPTTGAPTVSSGFASARYLGTTYRQQYNYDAETTYVAGEFYWRVERGQRTGNRDFAGPNGAVLSLERADKELTWSLGKRLDGAAVARAFGLEARQDQFKRADAAPFSAASRVGCVTVIVVVLLVILLLAILSNCSGPGGSSGSGWRSSGGSYGGYSSGGGHK